MRFKTDIQTKQAKDRDMRTIRRFAWLPVLFDFTWVWLERYDVLQVWMDLKIVVANDIKPGDEKKDKVFVTGEWRDISKRIIR